MQIIRSLAIVGETHCGSYYSLWPDPHNDAQEKLLHYWKTFWRTCDEEQVDTIVCTGEFIDGPNIKEYGRYLVTTNINEQRDAAISLWEPHVTPERKLISVSGSDYHSVAITFDADKAITQHLRGEHKGVMCNVTFPPSELIWNIAHDISAPLVYKLSTLNKEMVFSYEAEALKLLPVDHYDIIVRGHVHEYFYINDRRGHGLLVPCWKCYYPIKSRVRYHARHIPAIGGIIIHIYDDDTILIKKQIYPTPHVIGKLENV